MKYVLFEYVENREKSLRFDFGSVTWNLVFAPQAERAQKMSNEIKKTLVVERSWSAGSSVLVFFVVIFAFMSLGNAQDHATAESDLFQLMRNQIAPVSDYEVGKTTLHDVLDSGWRIDPADGVLVSISKIKYTTEGTGVLVLGLLLPSARSGDLASMDSFFRTVYDKQSRHSFDFDWKQMRSREDTRVIDRSLCRLSFENWILTAKECLESTGVVSEVASVSSTVEPDESGVSATASNPAPAKPETGDSGDETKSATKSDLTFAIQNIGIGSTEEELLEGLGEPISKKRIRNAPGLVFDYNFQGLSIHTDGGLVNRILLSEGPYSYGNGIAVGMTKAEVESLLGHSYPAGHIKLTLAGLDCFIKLFFTEERLSKFYQACHKS